MYLHLKHGLLLPSIRKSAKSKSKSKSRKRPRPNTEQQAAATRVARSAQVVALSSSINLMFHRWKEEWGVGWGETNTAKLADALAVLLASVFLGELRATQRQFVRCFLPVFCFTLVAKQQMLTAPYSADGVAKLERMTGNPSLFGEWVLSLTPGTGNVLRDDDFRREMMAAMNDQECAKNTPRATPTSDAVVWKEAQLWAYKRGDRHGDLVWQQHHTISDARLVVRRPQGSNFVTIDLISYIDSSPLAQLVTQEDRCITAEVALAQVGRRASLGDLDSTPDMQRAKFTAKFLGRIKGEVGGAVRDPACDGFSAERQTKAPELLWTACAAEEFVPPRSAGRVWGRSVVLSNMLGPYTRLISELQGSDPREVKGRCSTFKKKDAKEFNAMPGHARFNAQAWRCLHQTSTYDVEVDAEASPSGVAVTGKRLSVVREFPRVQHDSFYQGYFEDLKTFKSRVLRKDYETICQACTTKGLPPPPRSSEWMIFAEDPDARLCLASLYRCFDLMHQWVVANSALNWQDIFGARTIELAVSRRGRDGGFVRLRYNTADHASKVFTRFVTDCDGPSYCDTTTNNSKLLDIFGFSWVMRGFSTPWGRHMYRATDAISVPTCKLCLEHMTTPVFDPNAQATVCIHCKFKEMGPFKLAGPSGLCHSPGSDHTHGSAPPHHTLRGAVRHSSYFITGSSKGLTSMDEGGLFEEESFFAPEFVYTYSRSGRVVGAAAAPKAATTTASGLGGKCLDEFRVDSPDPPYNSVCLRVTRLSMGEHHGIRPTRHGAEKFYAWATVDGKLHEHEREICCGPNGEMNDNCLMRAFGLFMAERKNAEISFLGASGAYRHSLLKEAREDNQILLDLAMQSDSGSDSDPDTTEWAAQVEQTLLACGAFA